jgi:hypothetical protein
VSPDTSTVLSALLHAGFLAAAALWTPALAPDAQEGIDTLDDPHLIQQYHLAPAEQEEDDLGPTPADGNPDGHERTLSKCGSYQGGSMGEQRAPDTDLRYGIQGPPNPDPHIANQAGDLVAFTFPGISFPPYEGRSGGHPDAPMEPWAATTRWGTMRRTARGHVWGEEIGMSFGSPGAGLGLRRLCPECGGVGHGPSRPPRPRHPSKGARPAPSGPRSRRRSRLNRGSP